MKQIWNSLSYIIFWKTFATARGCKSWSILLSVTMWMPVSAPIARAVRRVSSALGILRWKNEVLLVSDRESDYF